MHGHSMSDEEQSCLSVGSPDLLAARHLPQVQSAQITGHFCLLRLFICTLTHKASPHLHYREDFLLFSY